jgi:hypothetical protein
MPERWEWELQKLRGVEAREPIVRQRVERGPSGHRPPARRDRLAAGIVAATVFLAAGGFAWRALAPGGGEIPFASGSWSVATVSFTTSAAGERLATLDVGGSEQEGLFGAATSPNEHYPYSWLPPHRLDDLPRPLEVPMGSELALDGDVAIKELLYGDAEQLDEGAGPDSGPIWADQPDFSDPYFLPWDEEPERTYLKFFGTWADGQVLDVYFEVVFVAPDVDLTDPGAEIVVTPEPMGAAFLYGGQRAPVGVAGGTYGNTSITSDLAGFDEGAIVAKVPAGTTLEIGGEHLVDASIRAGSLPFGEGGTPLDGRIPSEAGRYVLTMEVTWDGGSAGFLHQIEVVPAPEGEPVTGNEPSPPPSSAGSVVIDIRRTSEETGDPEAIARFGSREQWMCPDGWSVINPDGTTDEILFDCGQKDVFSAPVGMPIEVTGDFATVNATTRVSGDRVPGSSDEVPALDAGSILTLGYEVTWDDGSHASFWLLLTVKGDGAPGNPDTEIVVRIYGLGERSTDIPSITMTYLGETKRGCTEAFRWTLADGTKLDEASGRKGSIPLCSYDPLFRVPPGTPITLEVLTATEVFATRTMTPFYPEPDGFGASVRWPNGSGDFTVSFEVVGEPGTRRIVLGCPAEDRVPFSTPDGPRILPGGSAYIRGNMAGSLQTDVIEQMTREPGGTSEWEGVWQVVREGSVIAAVEFDSLRGVACRGSGIGGV